MGKEDENGLPHWSVVVGLKRGSRGRRAPLFFPVRWISAAWRRGLRKRPKPLDTGSEVDQAADVGCTMSVSETRMAPHVRSTVPTLAAQIALTARWRRRRLLRRGSTGPCGRGRCSGRCRVRHPCGSHHGADWAPLSVSGSFLALVVPRPSSDQVPRERLALSQRFPLGAPPDRAATTSSTISPTSRRFRWPLASSFTSSARDGAGPGRRGYYLLVFAAFIVALALNFVLSAGYMCWLDGMSLATQGSRVA